METKRFTKIDEGFVCSNCGLKVEPLGRGSCRDHCPKCLCSLHLDENPGDRMSNCGGILRPVRVETDARRGYMIVYKCDKCGAVKRNKAAHDAKVQPDDINLIIKLSVCRD